MPGMDFETWRPIVRYEGVYEVSDLGRVRSLDRIVPNSGTRGGSMSVKGRVLKTLIHKGYRQFTVSGKLCLVHRLVCEAFNGPSNGLWALHKDGDSLNNLASNLRWGTAQENAQDMLEHGTCHAARKTRCVRGHAFDEANTRITPEGSRACRTCHRERAQRDRDAARSS